MVVLRPEVPAGYRLGMKKPQKSEKKKAIKKRKEKNFRLFVWYSWEVGEVFLSMLFKYK